MVGERVDALSNKLAGLYSASLTDSLNDADEVVILHISDLHLNPIGAQLARRLAESFDVDAVVDTGDTTSFGTDFEGPYAELLADFPVPYLFVAGNHDSIPNREAIKATPGITALDGTVVDVNGVKIAGLDDPIITTVEDVPIDQREEREAAAAPELRRLIKREQPDVVAVHNPVILKSIVGSVPLAIAGHQHHYRLGSAQGHDRGGGRINRRDGPRIAAGRVGHPGGGEPAALPRRRAGGDRPPRDHRHQRRPHCAAPHDHRRRS